MHRKISIGTVTISEKEKALILDVIESKRVSMGDKVFRFESEFAKKFGTRFAISCNSGGSADTLALASLVVYGKANVGDEVIIPALTFISVVNSIIHARLVPKFVDIEPDTYNIDISKIEDAITERTKIIMPVHSFGFPVDLDPIVKLCKKYNITLIEDAAEAVGGSYKGKKLGTIGDVGTYSFYVAHMITTAEGGMCVTKNQNIAEIIRSLRAHGRACTCPKCLLLTSNKQCPLRFQETPNKKQVDKRFYFPNIGYSAKMNEFEAALGLGQLSKLEDFIKKRQKNLKTLNELLNKHGTHLKLPQIPKFGTIAPLCYPIVTKKIDRDSLIQYLEKNNIETRPMFGSIPTQQPAYSYLGHKLGDFPIAEKIGKNGFYIGCHQDLSEDDLSYINKMISEFLKNNT
ncbi:MAG: DegT/DnrJ/EryC1/StrS family aminotransferase [Candidatus Helarchaeota archaeon]